MREGERKERMVRQGPGVRQVTLDGMKSDDDDERC